MEIFKPPTDNLYKFMAIAGLIIAGISLFYPATKVYQLKLELINLENDTTLLESQVDKAQKDEAGQKEHYNETLHALKKKTQQLRLATNTALFFSLIAVIGFICGFYFTRKGFTLWYWKVQVYQDALLKKQAEDSIPNIVEEAKKRRRNHKS